jgi:hypothetical protein
MTFGFAGFDTQMVRQENNHAIDPLTVSPRQLKCLLAGSLKILGIETSSTSSSALTSPRGHKQLRHVMA